MLSVQLAEEAKRLKWTPSSKRRQSILIPQVDDDEDDHGDHDHDHEPDDHDDHIDHEDHVYH